MKSLRLSRWLAVLICTASFASACVERDLTAPSEPAGVAVRSAMSNVQAPVVTTTVWDFVDIAGGDGPLGSPATFTIPGAGSIVASTTVTNPRTEVFATGFSEPFGDEERGLGICGDFGGQGQCATNGDDEIGDAVPTVNGLVRPSVFMDLTGLAAGSVVKSVTIASLQVGEKYSAWSSTDGIHYTMFSSLTGSAATLPTVTVPVPAGTLYLRFDPEGGNYLVQSLTVQSSTTLPAMGRMTGGGSSIDVGVGRITKGLTIHCDITLSNNIEVNWPGHKWHLDKPITSAECTLDPSFSQPPPAAPFNTFHGTGVGQLDGVDGATIDFTFIDGGEPGTKDKAGIKIWDKNGNLVLNLPLSTISNGNLQAHFDQPHGCNVNKC